MLHKLSVLINMPKLSVFSVFIFEPKTELVRDYEYLFFQLPW